MRTVTWCLGLLASSLIAVPLIFGQTNPPPPDPHELVTRDPHILTKAADRSTALDLLDRARTNFNLHDISTPYTLKVSFETNGTAQAEGLGTMEEASDGASHWRWTAQLQDSLVVRIGTNGRVYGTNPDEPVPMRVQMLRSALHWPIRRNTGASAIRAGNVERDGKAITCLLLSGAIPQNAAPRAWVETEYCIDPATGLLQMWSEAPGIYAEYDYEGSGEFHGHILPRQISIFEEGRLAVQAKVERAEDAKEPDASLFKPTAEMADDSESYLLTSPSRFPMRVDPSDAPTSTFFQPVIVHAILDAEEGRVLDAEALQNEDKDLSQTAIDLVKSTTFPPSGFQQEVFINVQFHLPATVAGGPPVNLPSVLWVIWGEHRQGPPVKKPTRLGNQD